MLRVRDLVTRKIVTIEPEASVSAAWQICYANNVRHLPVCEGGRLVGMVSDRDLRDVNPPRGAKGARFANTWHDIGGVRIWDVMGTEPITVHPLDGIDYAARLLCDGWAECLPVVKEGAVVGVVTVSDVARTLVGFFGATGAGSWVEVEMPERPQAFAGLADALCGQDLEVTSVFLDPERGNADRYREAPNAGRRWAALRLRAASPYDAVRVLREAGYRVSAVGPLLPEGTSPEES